MKKFKDAFHGLFLGFQDKSVRVQLILAIGAVVAIFVLKMTVLETVAVVICIGLVVATEMLNTCIERLCDIVQPQWDEKIRKIKDLAAGAVLFVSLISLIVAILILIQHL